MSKQDYSNLPYETRPVGPWSYFGHSILYAIPLIGFIFLLIHAIGAPNVNIKNYARSYFCGVILVLFIIGIIILIVALTGGVSKITDMIGGSFSS